MMRMRPPQAGQRVPSISKTLASRAAHVKRCARAWGEDTRFAYDYGEWDRSLKNWRLECWHFFAAQCEQLGREPGYTMPVVCARFRVLYYG